MTTGYFMAPVRGKDGDDVEHKVKWDNIRIALEVAEWLRRKFPTVKWYVPHRNECFVEALIEVGISTGDIVFAFSIVAANCDFGVVFDGNGISNGMQTEITEMTLAQKPIVCIPETNEAAREQIAQVIASLNEV